MEINCLDQDLKEIQIITFNFNNTKFEIDVIDVNVKYLKIIYSTLKELSLLHLFLVQHRQEKLGIGEVRIIIIDNYEHNDAQVVVDSYWLNIATLSVQIGFNVQSISKKQNAYISDNHFNQQCSNVIQTNKNVIIVFSEYSEFDIQKIEQQFINLKNTNYNFADLKLPQDLDQNTFMIILQYISLKIHQIKDYSHFLPMTLAYNAFNINKNIQKQLESQPQIQGNDQKSLDYINNQLCQFQQVYSNAYLSIQNYSEFTQFNYLKMPLHLLRVFNFTKTQFIFQQMCDISYLFKAEFFCIYQQYNNLENAVISQSSRSGKSVTILSVFYFNILTMQKIPIYINLAYTTDQNDKVQQPLYKYKSIDVKNELTHLNQSFYDITQQPSFQFLFQNAITSAIKYQQAFATIYEKIKISLKQFNATQNQLLLIKLFSNLKKNNDFNSFTTDIQVLIQNVFSNSTAINSIDTKNIIILIDEILQPSKLNFNKLSNTAFIITEFFSYQFVKEAKSQLKNVFSVTNLNFMVKNVYQFYSQIFIIFGIEVSNKIDFSRDQTVNIQLITDKIKNVIETQTEDFYIYKLLANQTFIQEAKLEQIIGFICYTSPNFLNLKQFNSSKIEFYDCLKELEEYPTVQIFKQSLFKFVMKLYNPRAVETIFWRNIYHDLDITETDESKMKTDFETQLYQYLGGTQFNPTYFEINLQTIINFQTKYRNSTPFEHGWLDFLSIGTDLAIINFVAQNELLYTSNSSRSTDQYTQSHIIGGVQIHSSLLNKNYYQNSTISQADWDQLKKQIDSRSSSQDILQFYQLLVPELASEIQFICPLISPQIIIAGTEQDNSLITNCVTSHQYQVNTSNHQLQIINTYTQIINSLKIIRQKQNITLQSAQFIQQNQPQKIYVKQILSSNFFNHLYITTSIQLNQDMVFYFFYNACIVFKEYLLKKQEQRVIEKQAEIARLFLSYTTVSEITAIIMFILQVTQTKLVVFNQFLLQQKMKNMFLELIYVDNETNENHYLNANQAIKEISQYFKDSEFMFLQPCLDFIASIWEHQNDRMNRLMQHLYSVLANCYQSLIRLGSLQTNQPFIIAVPIDKNHLYTKLGIQGNISDFLVSFFPGKTLSDNELQQFNKQKLIINGVDIIFYTCIVESGIHTREMLVKKAYKKSNYIFQVTPQSTNLITDMPDLQKQMQLFDGENQISSEFVQEQQDKEYSLWENAQPKQQSDKYFIRFDQKLFQIFQNLFQQIRKDEKLNEYYVTVKTQPSLQKYINYRQKDKNIYLIKNIQNNIFTLSLNADIYVQQWINNKKNNKDTQVQNFLSNYFTIDFSLPQIKKYLQGEPFNKDVDYLLQQIANKLNNGGIIRISNCNFDQCEISDWEIYQNYKIQEVKLKYECEKKQKQQIISFLMQQKLIILNYDRDIVNTYQIKSKIEILQFWIKTQNFNKSTSKFKRLQTIDLSYFDQEITENLDSVLFETQLDINEVVNFIIDEVRSNIKTNQLSAQLFDINAKITEPMTSQEFEKENLTTAQIVAFLGKSLLLKYQINEQQNIIQLFVISNLPIKTIKYWLSNQSKNDLTDSEKAYINNFISLNLEEIIDSANFGLFASNITVKIQIEQIFENAVKQKLQKIVIKFKNLKTLQIEKQKGTDIEEVIQQNDFSADYVLKLLGRRVVFASKWLKEDNVVILSVLKSFMCQYCLITDKLVTCQDCDEHLCQEHVQKHCNEFEHFEYKHHDDSVFKLPKTTSMVEQPVLNTQPIELSSLETIKQWLASYPPQRSPEVENYLKLFANLTEENVKNANLKLFAKGMTVEDQIQSVIQKEKNNYVGYKITVQFNNIATPKENIHEVDSNEYSTEEILSKIRGLVIYRVNISRNEVLEESTITFYCI